MPNAPVVADLVSTAMTASEQESVEGMPAAPTNDGPDSPAHSPVSTKTRVMFWLRILVSLGILAVLVSKRPDLGDVIPARDHVRTISLLVLAVFVAAIGVVLSAWRWQRVLMVYGHKVALTRLTSHTLVGLAVNNVLPGTIGGDVPRITRLATDINNREIAFASVVIERLTGFLAQPLVLLAGLALRPSLLSSKRGWLAVLIAGITLGLLGLIVLLASHPNMAGRYADHENWMRYIGVVHEGFDRLRRDPRQALAVLATACAYQAAVALSVVIIATAIDLDVPTFAIVAFIPAVAMVQVLPISMSGFGVREGMLIEFLTPLGASKGQAIGLGLLWYSSLLVLSFLGLPALVAGRKKPTKAGASAAGAAGSVSS